MARFILQTRPSTCRKVNSRKHRSKVSTVWRMTAPLLFWPKTSGSRTALPFLRTANGYTWMTMIRKISACLMFPEATRSVMNECSVRSGVAAGVPDGMRVDEAGNLYVTGPRGVWVWDPQGHHLGTIVLPEQPANLTWGGNDYRTLYMTATHSVYSLPSRVPGFMPNLRTSKATQ